MSFREHAPRSFLGVYVSAFGLLLLFFTPPAFAQTRQTYGWVEKIRVLPVGTVIDAKLDTGADHSSLNASDLVEFERGTEQWVRFDVRNRYGKILTIEKPVIGTTKIKRQGAKSVRRFVIRLPICLGNTYLQVDVNLADRDSFDYQMLIGRSFLAGHAIVDPSVMYTTEPQCHTGTKTAGTKSSVVTSSSTGGTTP